MAKRRSLSDAFGGPEIRENTVNSKPVNTARDTSTSRSRAITATGEVEMVPGGRTGEMVSADKPVNMTFTVTARERYLWTLELKRRGRTAVSVLRESMDELMGEK